MAVISCPHCRGKLRFPDDSPPRRVKCVACGNTFTAGPKGAVAGGSSSTINIPKPPPAGPQKDFDFNSDEEQPRARRRDDDEDDRPKKRRDDEEDDRPKKRRDDEEDERDRPRSRHRDDEEDDRPRSRRRDDDDDDDRPRSRRRDDDDDDDRPRSRRRDDDDDDRPRGRGRSRYDDDDDYDTRDRPKETKAQYRNARTAMTLAGIGFWCQVGALAVVILTLFLFYIAGEFVEELYIPAGLAGFANWILGCVAFSFLIAGPKKGNLLGLTIALVAVSAIHLFLVIYVAFDNDYGGMSIKRSGTSVSWYQVPTMFNSLMMMLLRNYFHTATLIAALLELARFILFALVVKELGRVCKDRDVSGSAQMQLIIMPSVLGICFLLFLIMRLISKNAGMGSEGRYIYFFMVFIEHAGYIAVYVMSALLCMKAKEGMFLRKK